MHNEKTIAHMSMIQGIVTRLETNCFTLKALAMTLAVAILAFIGSLEDPSWTYPLVGYLPIITFWVMDSKYLQIGRLYRELFNCIRKGDTNSGGEFSMDTSSFEKQSLLKIAFSWSIFWFYLSILSTFTLVTYVIYF